jgi:3'(2'), 5'-bisphosphate nucleotidase
MLDALLLDELADIAVEAGASISALRQGRVAATAKADGSPVTQADLAANDIIINRLADKYSDIPVLSEETPPADNEAYSEYLFLVDPLDGTREFLSGSNEFTVNIALLDQLAPKAGAIYAPALGVIYVGAAGEGARRATVENSVIGPWRTISAVAPSGDLRAATSRSHLTAETRAFLDGYSIGRVVSIGSSLKFCLVAAGEADIYPRLGRTMEWDTAAGDAILRAAGGSVLTLDGKPLTYNKRDAAGGHVFENPWFVAAGAFDPLDARWRIGSPAATGVLETPVRNFSEDP